MDQIHAYDVNAAAMQTRSGLQQEEVKQSAVLQQALDSEEKRQVAALEMQQAKATAEAQFRTIHLRQTAEEWADNEAKRNIMATTDATLGKLFAKADETATLRQKASEFAKGAIKAAAQSLEVAQEAQKALEKVPKDSLKKAGDFAKNMATEQEELRLTMLRIEEKARAMAKATEEGHKVAEETLKKATLTEEIAAKALKTARGNAQKIAALKTRAQALAVKAEDMAKAKTDGE